MRAETHECGMSRHMCGVKLTLHVVCKYIHKCVVRTPLVRGRSDAGLRLAMQPMLEILLSAISLAIL